MNYRKIMSETVPQSEPLDDRQVKNNAGGYVYEIDDKARLMRFLILGSDSPTYYQNARDLTLENAAVVKRCYDSDPASTVATIVEVSKGGRAPKNDSAIFALAIGSIHRDVAVRRMALAALNDVCRTATHLFQFVGMAKAIGRGNGRAMQRALATWYDSKEVNALAYQMVKYRSREGYDHNRLIDVARPKDHNIPGRKALYRWAIGKDFDSDALPDIVQAHLAIMDKSSLDDEAIGLIRGLNLPWEAIPTAMTTDPALWEVMLPKMGLTALIRNLGKMTSIGVLDPLTPAARVAAARLSDQDEIRKALVHPFTILQAMAVYGSGRGMRGSLSWNPNPSVVAALDKAFYLAFANVEPSGKRTLIGLDVSGSMDSALMGSPLSVREAAAAMCMVTMRSEPETHIFGFSRTFVPLDISAADSLQSVVRKTSCLPFSETDCSLPMLHALQHRIDVDTFIVYTDSETWAGGMHPTEALQRYRKVTGIPAKLVVVGMTSTGFSIADPNDAGMLDVVGFDSAAPAVIADFSRG